MAIHCHIELPVVLLGHCQRPQSLHHTQPQWTLGYAACFFVYPKTSLPQKCFCSGSVSRNLKKQFRWRGTHAAAAAVGAGCPPSVAAYPCCTMLSLVSATTMSCVLGQITMLALRQKSTECLILMLHDVHAGLQQLQHQQHPTLAQGRGPHTLQCLWHLLEVTWNPQVRPIKHLGLGGLGRMHSFCLHRV